jgi:chromosome segregation protein
MYLERVEIGSFKSFADPATVEFCAGFTCITGPNGSGKSNIADAICFALGESSPTKLRVRSLGDLVSTSAKENATACVILHFVRVSADVSSATVEANVKRSGHRTFKLDGIIRPIAHIRTWLKTCGLDVSRGSFVLAQVIANTGTDIAQSKNS